MRPPNARGWVGWPEKLPSPAGGRRSTWELAPQRPPGETSEPAEDTQKKPVSRKDSKTGWEQRQPVREIGSRGSSVSSKGDNRGTLLRVSLPGLPWWTENIPNPGHPGGLGRCGASFVLASIHKQGKPSGNGRPDLAAQDSSDSILRVTFPNVVRASPI